jgi:hypothetical protein
MYLAAGVNLSEAPDPLHPPVTHCMYEYVTLYCTYSHREGGGKGEPVTRLEGR